MTHVNVLLTNGEQVLESGNVKEAEKIFTSCIESLKKSISENEDADQPTDVKHKLAVALNNRGFSKYKQVEFDAAIEDYTDALQWDPTLASALYNRGMIHYRLNDFKGALSDMEQSLKLKPSFKEAEIAKNKCLDQLKKNDVNR